MKTETTFVLTSQEVEIIRDILEQLFTEGIDDTEKIGEFFQGIRYCNDLSFPFDNFEDHFTVTLLTKELEEGK